MSKNVLMFYAPCILAATMGEADDDGNREEFAAEATISDIKLLTADLRQFTKTSVLVQDAANFRGELESNVSHVVLLGPDDEKCLQRVAEAYSEAEVEVSSIENFKEDWGGGAETDGDGVFEKQGLSDLKARATELGVNFPSNIGMAKLADRVLEAEQALKDAEGDKNE
jgi:hypothetical protein